LEILESFTVSLVTDSGSSAISKTAVSIAEVDTLSAELPGTTDLIAGESPAN